MNVFFLTGSCLFHNCRINSIRKCLSLFFLLSCIFLISANTTFAQTFSSSPSGAIPDAGAETCFSINTTGLPTSINNTFGIRSVCINVTHTYDEDLNIYLQAPNGTYIELSMTNGKQFDNYTNTCFSIDASTRIREGSAPFTGSYRPEGDLESLNNGQNPNGTWRLCLQDLVAGDIGTLTNWSITFGAAPSCSVNQTIATLPFSSSSLTTCGMGNPYTSTNACGSTYMNGDDYVFKYIPSAAEAVSISLTNANANAGLFILDMCPSSAASRCIMASTGSSAKIDTVSLLEGHPYYIVVSTLPSPQCASFDFSMRRVGLAGADDCANATTISTNGRYFGDSHKAYPQTRTADPNVTTEFTCNATIDNIVYYKFRTNSSGGNIDIKVSSVNCEYNRGIQFSVFQTSNPCAGSGNWGAPVTCEAKTLSNITRTLTGLPPNTDYFILVDGFTGDECSWVLELIGPVALPVSLINFKARNEGSINVIDWSTVKEENNDYFIVERSHDALSFEALGRIEGINDPGQRNDYIFIDNNPISGAGYYRLRQVDKDGSTSYSEVVSVNRANTMSVLNPVRRNEPILLIYNEDIQNQQVSVEVYDVSGKKAISLESSFKEPGSLSIDQHLPKGVYLIAIASGEHFYKEKIIIE